MHFKITTDNKILEEEKQQINAAEYICKKKIRLFRIRLLKKKVIHIFIHRIEK